MKSILTPRVIFISVIIFIAAFSRLLPHIPNFTPIAAIALFGGAYFKDKRLGYVIPLLAMFISDVLIGFHGAMLFVYIGFVLTTMIGSGLHNRINVSNLFVASLLSSVTFFLITNFGVWLVFNMPQGIDLLSTFTLGIPFFAPTLLGDLFYSAILFGAFYLAQIQFPLLATVKSNN